MTGADFLMTEVLRSRVWQIFSCWAAALPAWSRRKVWRGGWGRNIGSRSSRAIVNSPSSRLWSGWPSVTRAEVTGYDPDKRYVVVPRGRFERRIAVHCHAADQIADPAAVIIGRTGHLASCRSRAYATRNI